MRWAQRALWLTGLGIAAVSVATPLVSQRIFEKWFALPNLLLLLPIPLLTALAFALVRQRAAAHGARGRSRRRWVPFAAAVGSSCSPSRAGLQPVSRTWWSTA